MVLVAVVVVATVHEEGVPEDVLVDVDGYGEYGSEWWRWWKCRRQWVHEYTRESLTHTARVVRSVEALRYKGARWPRKQV